MEHAVDVRLAGPAPLAQAARDALARALATRGRAGAVLTLGTAERPQPALALEIEVRPAEHVALRLPPLPLSAAPEDAAGEAVRFLERWGFLSRAAPAAAP